MYLIYKFRCRAENKSYIGYTFFVSGKETADDAAASRFKEHAQETDTPLGKAIATYGGNNFIYEELKQCDSKAGALEWEHIFIRIYDTLVPNGYNRKP